MFINYVISGYICITIHLLVQCILIGETGNSAYAQGYQEESKLWYLGSRYNSCKFSGLRKLIYEINEEIMSSRNWYIEWLFSATVML